jgi:spore germination protein YaaH
MSNENNEIITIEDVEIAIAILSKWLEQNQQVERLLNRLRPRSYSSYGFNIESIVNSILEKQQFQTQQHQEAGELARTLISPEEKERLRKIAEKYRVKNKEKYTAPP